LTIWFLLLFGAANTYLIGMTPFFSSLIVAIFLYLPGAVLVGYGIDQFAGVVTQRLSLSSPRAKLVGSAALVILLASAGLVGMVYTSKVIEPDNGFVRPADLKAMEWIRENTPRDARFSIAIHFWTPVVAHGLDGGYWIPFLADRQTTIPPEVYSSDGSSALIASTNQLLVALAQVTAAPQMWQLLRQHQVTHVYLGNRPTYLQPEFFDADPAHFKLLYTGDHVWIYAVLPER
jgi:hypothetical protein